MSSEYLMAAEPVRPVAAVPAEPLAYATPGTTNNAVPLPLLTRARIAGTFGYTLAGMSAVYVLIQVWDIAQLNAAEAGTLTAAQEETLMWTAVAFGLCYLLAAAGFLIALMFWVYRAVANVRAMTGDSRFGPGLSVGGWFIPFASLVMPFMTLRDLNQRTGTVAGGLVATPFYLGAFWLAWVFSDIGMNGISRWYDLALTDGDLATAKTASYVLLFIGLVDIALWVYLVRFVFGITRVHDGIADRPTAAAG